MQVLKELFDELKSKVIKSVGEGGVVALSPEAAVDVIQFPHLDLRKELAIQRSFERAKCNHILCGDTRDSCVIMSWILRLQKPKFMYEIGRYRGWSTAQLAFANASNAIEGSRAKFISADPHVFCADGPGWNDGGGGQCGGEVDWEISQQNVKMAGVGDFVSLVRDFGSEHVKTLPSEIDFAFIDGDHTYNAAKTDIEEVGKKMVSGGVCVLHDVWGNKFSGRNYGPTRAYYEASDELWERCICIWDVGVLIRR